DRQQRGGGEGWGLVGEGVDDLHPAGHPTGRGAAGAAGPGQNPVFECTFLRTVGCSRPRSSSVAHASAMSCASPVVGERPSVCLTSTRMIFTCWALGGIV